MFTIWTGGGDFGIEATGVTDKAVGIGMEGERKVTIGAEGLPATFFADGKGCGATTIMKN